MKIYIETATAIPMVVLIAPNAALKAVRSFQPRASSSTTTTGNQPKTRDISATTID